MTVNVPKTTTELLLTFPSEHVMLVTLQRDYNMLNMSMQNQLSQIWKWYDETSNLRCAIVTGNQKSFCAGADLKEWLKLRSTDPTSLERIEGGFGGMSRRQGKKPIIAAVNGLCLGGGMEMTVNCDLVVAAKDAIFGLPEVTRGVYAKMGALGRLVRFVGLQRASELALLGEPITAVQAFQWGLVNRIVDPAKVVATAIALANRISANSPDSVLVSRHGIIAGLENGSLERATQLTNESMFAVNLEQGHNIEEGLVAFREKRPAKWKDSKL